jgi:hypothetical protein
MNSKPLENLIRDAGHLSHAMDTHWFWSSVSEETKNNARSEVERLREAARHETAARATRDMAVNRLTLADKTLRKWLTNARLVVMLARGPRWSDSWQQTGFTNAKMRVPKELDQRLILARALVSFFARHPEFSVAFAEITATRGRAVYERVMQSAEILNIAKADLSSAAKTCQSARHEVQHLIDIVIPELKDRITAKLKPRDVAIKRPRSVRRAAQRASTESANQIPLIDKVAA